TPTKTATPRDETPTPTATPKTPTATPTKDIPPPPPEIQTEPSSTPTATSTLPPTSTPTATPTERAEAPGGFTAPVTGDGGPSLLSDAGSTALFGGAFLVLMVV